MTSIGGFRETRRSTWWVIVCSILLPAIAGAQTSAKRITLKPASMDPTARPACTGGRPSSLPTDQNRQRARDLAQAGQQAAILGDSPTALRDLREASTLDPTDPDLAYQLARAYETAKDAAAATKEYCRFLALSPTAPEAGEILEKVRILASSRVDPAADSALVVFQAGVVAYQGGRLSDADGSFSKVIGADSTWADAYYNRAQVRLARADRDRARVDFEQYLKLKPLATDRTEVETQIVALRRQPLSSFTAFALGAIVPGAGQFYTRRPMRGLLTMAAVGGAIGYGLLQTSTTITVQETFTDPFGNPYTEPRTRIRTERKNLVVGAAAAGGIAAVSAINAAIFAHSSNEASRRVALSILPDANRFVARVTVLTP